MVSSLPTIGETLGKNGQAVFRNSISKPFTNHVYGGRQRRRDTTPSTITKAQSPVMPVRSEKIGKHRVVSEGPIGASFPANRRLWSEAQEPLNRRLSAF
jgi:hypothetical protein